MCLFVAQIQDCLSSCHVLCLLNHNVKFFSSIYDLMVAQFNLKICNSSFNFVKLQFQLQFAREGLQEIKSTIALYCRGLQETSIATRDFHFFPCMMRKIGIGGNRDTRKLN